MASSKEYLEYVLDLLSGLDDIRYRYMMSEYVIYYRDKVFGGVYDDRFLIKPTKTVLERIPDAEFAIPYPGGRKMVVLDTENRAFIKQLVTDMAEEIPTPKEKKRHRTIGSRGGNDMSLKTELDRLDDTIWQGDGVCIKPIETQDELIYAIFECQLNEEQTELVNPAGFSIGRAYLFPGDHVPCLIYDERKEPIGFISLCKWLGKGDDCYSWSYYIDRNHQGKGYGRKAAGLAIRILKAADPKKTIKLSTEKSNEKAQRLYLSLGFQMLPEFDGDDLVFGL